MKITRLLTQGFPNDIYFLIDEENGTLLIPPDFLSRPMLEGMEIIGTKVRTNGFHSLLVESGDAEQLLVANSILCGGLAPPSNLMSERSH